MVDLRAAEESLRQQVASGGIQQWQMDAELNRLKAEAGNSGQAVDLAAAEANLAQQVASGGISQAQADAELERLRGLNSASGSAPQRPGPLPADADLSTPEGALQGQADANKYAAEEQARNNRVNEVGPYGSATYTQNPDGSYTRNYALSDPQQQILDQTQQRDQQIGGLAGNAISQAEQNYRNPLTFEGLPQAPRASFEGAPELQRLNLNNLPKAQAPRDYSQYGQLPSSGDTQAMRQRLENEQYKKWERDQEPRFSREMNEFEQNMADRGVSRGSKQWDYEYERLRDSQERARQDARASASQFGGQEFQRQFGADLSSRQQGVSETNNLYDMSADERARVTGERVLDRNASVQDRQIATGERVDLFNLGGQERDRATSERSYLRNNPLQEAGSLLNLQNGIVNPQFSGISNIGLNPYDVGGMSLGYQQIQQNADLANLDAETRIQIAGGIGGGGGGGGGYSAPQGNGGLSGAQIASLDQQIGFQNRGYNPYIRTNQQQGGGGTIW